MSKKTLVLLFSAVLIVLLVALVLFLVNFSGQSKGGDSPLARVEDLTITLNDLKEVSLLTNFSLGETAERWIDEQVLLEHAKVSRPYDRSLSSSRLRAYERRVIAGMVIDSLLMRYIKIDPESIREYYVNNLHDFQFQDSAALVIHLGFTSIEHARVALEALRSSPSFLDSLSDRYNYDRQIVYRRRFIPVLDRAIFAATENQVYGPIASDFGYHVFLVERFFNRGHTIPFSLVEKHIYEHTFQQQLPLARSTILDSLRETLDIEVYHD
ncbi:MAG: peptidyl-prolyl cis-trans isomerase [Fidelibacterota bacterium]|nr:MAG: peptidyl-prolyl cis-trans isomerase [Candidatus Neomarinimicrobiota bacterium]